MAISIAEVPDLLLHTPRQNRLPEVLQIVACQTATTPNLAEVFSTAAEAMQQRLHYERVAVHLANNDNGDLTLCAVAGVAAPVSPMRYYLRHNEGTPGQTVYTGQTTHVTNFASPASSTPLLGLTDTVEELSVPIRQGGRIVGALTVSALQPDQFDASDEEILMTIAEQLAAAIRGAELSHKLTEHAARESLLTDISCAVNSVLDLNQLLKQAVATIGEKLKVDRCHISQINLPSRTILTEHEYITPLLFERRAFKPTETFTPALEQLARALQSGQVIMATEQEPHALPAEWWNALTERYGVRSLVWLPILNQPANSFYTLGLMQVTHPRYWDDDDITLLRGIASQLALALRNAELFDAAQHTAAALKAKNAELETFTYTVSHDLQAPVVSLSGFAELLKTHYQAQLDERGNLYLGRITSNAEFLNHMLQELLELSRIGRVEEPDEHVLIGEVIEQVLDDLAQPLTERNVQLTLTPDWPAVRYAPVRLRQVFSNLISNAIKFLGPQTQPHIELGWRHLATSPDPPAAGPIECFVKDNGIGIAPADQHRIFIPFQRLGMLEVEGTGVGLSIVKRIVEGRGGIARVESTPGSGATFYFTIPAGLTEAGKPL